jgi:hypothetical protein
MCCSSALHKKARAGMLPQDDPKRKATVHNLQLRDSDISLSNGANQETVSERNACSVESLARKQLLEFVAFIALRV